MVGRRKIHGRRATAAVGAAIKSKTSKVPKVRDLLQDEEIAAATATFGSERRYSKRVRRQFHPFTIPLSRSSKVIIHHVRTKTTVTKKVLIDEKQPRKPAMAKTRKRKATEQKSPVKKVIQNDQPIAPVVRVKRRKNDLLKPRPEIEDYVANPYLYSPKAPKFVSVSSYSRINAHRLVIQKNIDNLRRLAYDQSHFNIAALQWPFSATSKLTPEGEAVLAEDSKLLAAISDLMKDDKVARAQLEPVLLREHSTGQMNVHMLGHATANIQMTRGGREGVNALLDKHVDYVTVHDQLHVFVRNNVSFDTLTYLQKNYDADFSTQIHKAVRYGHRRLAAYMIKGFAPYGFNDLHIATLANNTQPLKKFMPISTTKKAQLARNITPFHTAAINPNVNYLKSLLAIGQQYGPDLDGWDLIHYAAVCEGTGPLKHLLSIGMLPTAVNKKMQMPLHCAAKAGRFENVKILIDAIQKHEKTMRLQLSQIDGQSGGDITQTEDEGNNSQEEPPALPQPPVAKKRKMASDEKNKFLNSKAAKGKSALYMAASRGHTEVVKLFLDVPDIVVDTQTSAVHKKLTPLMIACARGYLDVANMLIDVGGAIIEKGDKLKKTSLTHAVIGGQVHIVAMLLRRGASPLSADSSGNTAAHYAAAFGWFECLKLLAKADSNCLAASNDWHLTPLSVAYLKGHYGIMEWLVDGPYSDIVNINCPDQSGASLLSSVIKTYKCFKDKTILSQLQFLIGKGASCLVKDVALNSPFHYFCTVKYMLHVENLKTDDADEEAENRNRLTKDEYRRCFDLFLANGAKLLEKNDQQNDPLHLAIKCGNLFLVELIFTQLLVEDPTLRSLEVETDQEGSSKEGSFLHLLISLPFQVYNDRSNWARNTEPCGGQYNIIPLLDKLISHDRQKVIRWLRQRDDSGRTPLLILCERYAAIQNSHIGNRDEIKSLKEFLNTMCAIVRRFISLDPKILLQTVVNGYSNIIKHDDQHATIVPTIVEDDNDVNDNFDVESEDDNDGKSTYNSDENDEDDDSSASTENDDERPVYSLEGNRKTTAKKGQSVFGYVLNTNKGFWSPVTTVVIGSVAYNITSRLLTTVVEAAKEHHFLLELLNQRDENDYTALLRTVSSNDLTLSMYLLREAHAVATVESGEKVDAARVRRKFCVQKNQYVPWGKSVLMFAVENCMFSFIEELDLTLAEWNACTEDCESNAFHFAAQIVSFKSVMLYELLKQKGVEQKADKDGRYPLHIAVASLSKTDVDVLTEPLDWFTKNEVGIYSSDKNGCMPFHYCFISLERDVFARMTIDPVAILSVLLSAMQKNMIHKADNQGYTALHYAALFGANICAVTLLQAGANQHAVNDDGNTPLALAVLRRNEACTLTLIQAKSDVVREIHLAKREKETTKPKDEWVWIPRRRPAIKPKPPPTIPSLIVRNEWQGIVYVLLNVMGKNVRTVGGLVRAALEHRKYNLAQTLLEMFRILLQDEPLDDILEELDIFYIFVENLASDQVDKSILKILDSLSLLGCKWYSKQKDGIYRSRVVECLASNGRFSFMAALHELDQKSTQPMWNSVNYELNSANPLVGIIETWIQYGSNDGTKFWLKHFANKFGINSLMLYRRPAFDGMYPCMTKQPDPEFSYSTPLIRAIQCANIRLVEFLLQESDLKTDVNKPDESGVTPLMHACMVNSETIIQLLFDPNVRQNGERQNNTSTHFTSFGTQGENNAGIGGLFGGFGSYGDVSGKNSGDNAQSAPSASDPAQANEKRKKFVLKSDLDPLKQSIISGRLVASFGDGAESRRTKIFIHFMLEPCGWENVDLFEALCGSIPQAKIMIKQLAQQGAADISPIHIAHARCQARMLAVMKKLAAVNMDLEVEYPVVDISNIKTEYNIDMDCERFLACNAEARQERTKCEFKKTYLRPHENSGYRGTGEICMKQLEDGGEAVPYKVTLTKTDMKRGYYGFHNYYRMELIKRKGSELYIVFTNWGRIGDAVGQYQRTPFGSLEEADKEFSAIFRSKTGNEFADIRNFDEKPTKYRLLKVDSETSGNIADLEIDFCKSTAINVRAAESAKYKLIKDISNVRRLQERTRMVCKPRSRIPFGCISRTDLLEARKILTKLRTLVNELQNCRGPESTLKFLEAQSEATNEFYRLMPLSGYESGALPMIDNTDVIDEYEKTIESLFEMEIAGKLVTAAAYNMDRIDPYMYISSALECELTLLDPNDLMTQRILQNIQISSSSCSVEGIYAVKSRQAAEAYNNNALEVANHRYLWHGTKPENLLSILKVGLLASPDFAVQTGQAFGQGIYFADVFAKSENYCTASSSGLRYCMLCEVALGEIYYGQDSETIRYGKQDKLSRFDTLKVIGEQGPDPHYDMTMENGCILPLGGLISVDCDEIQKRYNFYPYTNYNEYIVRDRTLTLVRYLVVFK